MNEMNVPFIQAESRRTVDPAVQLDFRRLLTMARRQAWIVAICAFLGGCLGLAYIATTPPSFVAYASVLVEDRLGKLVEEVSPAPLNQRTDATVLSEMEIVRSQRMAQIVSRDLNLAQDAEFMNPPVSLLSRTIGTALGTVRGWVLQASALIASDQPVPAVPSAEPVAAPVASNASTARQPGQSMSADEIAVLRLRGGLLVGRSGRSYVISIGFRSHSPQLARDITNAYVRAYVADGLETSFAKTRQAAEWLQGRLEELEGETRTASLEAERFRALNGLTSTRGLLVTEQQVSDLNSQLALVRGESARAAAQLAQGEMLLDRNPERAIAGATFVSDGEPINPTLATLRESYLSIISRERDIVERYGEDHPQAAALRRAKVQQEARVMDELRSTVQSLSNIAQSAQAREEALAESVAAATGQNIQASQAQVKLRELEQRAETLGKLNQTFLSRYEELSKQTSFPIARVRTLSEAELPLRKAAPSLSKAVAATLFLGAFVGAGIGGYREFRERFFRNEEDVRRTLRHPFLGYIPKIDVRSRKAKTSAGAATPVPETPDAARMLATLASPSSMLAETLRNVRVAADVTGQGSECFVLGIVSVLPGEGKSTIAANFAAQLAGTGSPTLLIDTDLRKPSVSRTLAPQVDRSLVHGVLQGDGWETLAHHVEGTNLIVIPNAMTGRSTHTSELLSSPAMRAFIDRTRTSFKYIVMDLPPLAPVSDARAAASLVDGMLMVVQWGATPRAVVRTQLDAAPTVRSKMLGIVLNQVDLKRLGRYEADGGQGHYLDRYSEYYTQPSAGEFMKAA